MFKLRKSALKRLQGIVAKIKSGKYSHHQGDWHCGTSHCLFGWYVTEQVAKEQNKPELLKSESYDNEFLRLVPRTETTIKDQSCKELGLTGREFRILSNGDNSIEKIEEHLYRLAEGKRYLWDNSLARYRWVTPEDYKADKENFDFD